MVTVEEIAAIEVFAMLGADEHERLARVAADISLLPGEYAANAGDDRALFAVLEGRIEAVKVVDGIERVVGERLPGDVFGEVPIVLGTVFPVGFRAAVASRVMRIEPADYHAIAAADPIVAKSIGALASLRMAARGACRGSPPSRRRRGRSSSGSAGIPPARSCVTSSTATRSAFSGCSPARRTQPDSGRGRCPPRPTGRRSALVGGKTVVRPQLRRVAELLGLGTEPGRRLRHGDHRRRPRRSRRGRLRRLGGSAHARGRARGAGRPGRHVVADRELPRVPLGRLRRRAREPRAPAGAAARRRDPRHPDDHPDRRPTREVHLDGGDVLRARTIILACGVSWRRLEVAGFDRLVGKGIFYGAARSEAPNVHGLDIHIVGAGNSAGQAAMFFSSHARSVTILYRGESLEKSMSRYLIDQLATRRTSTCASAARSWPPTARSRSRRSTSATRRRGETVRLDSGGLFIFIGADAETDWLPPEIALDRRGYVLTGRTCAPQALAARRATPTCSRRAFPASSPAATSAPGRSSASPRPSAKEAWRSPSCTST